MSRLKSSVIAAISFFTIPVLQASAIEYPIGKPQQGGGLEVAAVYLQPVTMEPAGKMPPASETDIHLEADIHALADNPNGLAEGEWVPYLVVRYELTKIKDGKTQSGTLMPMIANDGLHYGRNVKMAGPGKYSLTFEILPPSANKAVMFGRHVDRETGVAPWFRPFRTHYEFVFAGTGKKGAY